MFYKKLAGCAHASQNHDMEILGPCVLGNPFRDSRRAPRGGVHTGQSANSLESLAPQGG